MFEFFFFSFSVFLSYMQLFSYSVIQSLPIRFIYFILFTFFLFLFYLNYYFFVLYISIIYRFIVLTKKILTLSMSVDTGYTGVCASSSTAAMIRVTRYQFTSTTTTTLLHVQRDIATLKPIQRPQRASCQKDTLYMHEHAAPKSHRSRPASQGPTSHSRSPALCDGLKVLDSLQSS